METPELIKKKNSNNLAESECLYNYSREAKVNDYC